IDNHYSPEIVAGIKKAFEKEAKVLEDLGVRSGNIPCLYDYFSSTVTDPQLTTPQEFNYLVQQYIAGEDLKKELEQQGRFPEEQVLALLNNILPVLKFIHKNNVIHRDIKPSNIVRSKEEDNKF
ncbi:MAG: serine/threonine protein kinase, partial [Anabaena sp. CRKS33]